MIVEFELSSEEYSVLQSTALKLFEYNKIKHNEVGELARALSLSKANEFLRMAFNNHWLLIANHF